MQELEDKQPIPDCQRTPAAGADNTEEQGGASPNENGAKSSLMIILLSTVFRSIGKHSDQRQDGSRERLSASDLACSSSLNLIERDSIALVSAWLDQDWPSATRKIIN